jgi:hypothetical protein
MQTAALTSNTSLDTVQSMVIQSRTVYGRGTVVTLARFEDGVFFLEEHTIDGTTVIPLMSSEARKQLQLFLRCCQAPGR